MSECTKYEHVGPIEMRRKQAFRRAVAQEQCGACLRGIGPKIKLERIHSLASIPFWLEKPRKRFGFRTGRGNSKSRTAARYYRSKTWKRLRAQRLALDNYECVICGNEATEVDHTTYERFGGSERLEDLQSLCSDCHREIRCTRMGGFGSAMRRTAAALVLLLAACATSTPASRYYADSDPLLVARFEESWHACRIAASRYCRPLLEVGAYADHLQCSAGAHAECMNLQGYEQIGPREWILTREGRRMLELAREGSD